MVYPLPSKDKYRDLPWVDQDEDFANPDKELHKDFEALYQTFEGSRPRQVKEGQIIRGKIIEIRADSVVVDVGHKSVGQIPRDEFRQDDLVLQSEIDVYVDVFEDDNGEIILSKEKADIFQAWDRISVAFEKGEFVQGTVLGKVKGGLSVDIGVKAFLPGSQIEAKPTRNLEKYLGQTLDFKIIKFNKRRGNIVLSRKVVSDIKEKIRTRENIEVGSELPGSVKNITDYGAFIDIGGIDGLLHITDISWGRIGHPSEVLTVGQKINVKVLSYDPATRRISLGMKHLLPDPWELVPEKFPIDGQFKAKVISLADYGAFVELEPGVEGLIHITEMTANKKIKHPSKLVSVGEEVDVTVIGIDPSNRRISLRMKGSNQNPWESITQKYQEGDVLRARICNITDFGIFIGIQDGIDGLIHISDISWNRRQKNLSEMFKKGDEVEARVTNIDAENMKFSLSMKALSEDPFMGAAKNLKPGYKASAPVTEISSEGIYLELMQHVDGFIPKATLEAKSLEPAIGDTLDYVIDKFRKEDRVFELSLV